MTWEPYKPPQLNEAERAVREAFVRIAEKAAEAAAEEARNDLRKLEEGVLQRNGKVYYAFTEDEFAAWIKDAVYYSMLPEPGYCLPA